jgi:diketogulonate reductase-like aldo/keto reductase
MEYVTLNTGAKMPIEGFGVFQVKDKDVCYESVYNAIKTGYRLFDTATSYGNEDALGRAVKDAIKDGLCTREELFITSKLWVSDMINEETAYQGVLRSLEKSGLEYLDLYLLHQAMRDYFAAWRGLERAYKEGKLKAIGVSNFYPNILTNFCETVEIKPAVNQIETHPWYVQQQALDVAKYYGVIVEAWAPLGGGRYNEEDLSVIQKVADKYHKTVAQVLLRWNVDRGVVVIPKSTHSERIQANFEIFDFKLTQDEINEISKLDMGYSGTRAKHFDPDFVRMCLGRNL